MDTLKEKKNGQKTQGFFANETWEIFDGRSSTSNENPERSGLRSKPIWSELYVAFVLRFYIANAIKSFYKHETDVYPYPLATRFDAQQQTHHPFAVIWVSFYLKIHADDVSGHVVCCGGARTERPPQAGKSRVHRVYIYPATWATPSEQKLACSYHGCGLTRSCSFFGGRQDFRIGRKANEHPSLCLETAMDPVLSSFHPASSDDIDIHESERTMLLIPLVLNSHVPLLDEKAENRLVSSSRNLLQSNIILLPLLFNPFRAPDKYAAIGNRYECTNFCCRLQKRHGFTKSSRNYKLILTATANINSDLQQLNFQFKIENQIYDNDRVKILSLTHFLPFMRRHRLHRMVGMALCKYGIKSFSGLSRKIKHESYTRQQENSDACLPEDPTRKFDILFYRGHAEIFENNIEERKRSRTVLAAAGDLSRYELNEIIRFDDPIFHMTSLDSVYTLCAALSLRGFRIAYYSLCFCNKTGSYHIIISNSSSSLSTSLAINTLNPDVSCLPAYSPNVVGLIKTLRHESANLYSSNLSKPTLFDVTISGSTDFWQPAKINWDLRYGRENGDAPNRDNFCERETSTAISEDLSRKSLYALLNRSPVEPEERLIREIHCPPQLEQPTGLSNALCGTTDKTPFKCSGRRKMSSALFSLHFQAKPPMRFYRTTLSASFTRRLLPALILFTDRASLIIVLRERGKLCHLCALYCFRTVGTHLDTRYF
ncbi:hypothetical protein EAG_01074 [Camponotus floridanus]|uniref:Uncharacterized protein n=1 Tax=Camponotus floridanus TaxID=104421 RepID=E2AB58_CAMFO|nr:hypothetical protein EAG_01074 [Camponotus floridanus]